MKTQDDCTTLLLKTQWFEYIYEYNIEYIREYIGNNYKKSHSLE